jgi:hypothetical protein
MGFGRPLMWLLQHGAGRWPVVRWLMKKPKLRDWFYYRARRPTAGHFMWLVRPGQVVMAIGDAADPGKSKEAIAGAFEAALLSV